MCPPALRPLTLTRLPGEFAMVRLGPEEAVPAWALETSTTFTSLTRTGGELSLIVPADAPPAGVEADGGWFCLGVDASFGLDVPGIAHSVLSPLASAGQSVFVVATYDTDYFLVRDAAAATAVLEAVGHRVRCAS